MLYSFPPHIGSVPCIDWIMGVKGFDPVTGDPIRYNTWLYVQNPVTGTFYGAFARSSYDVLYCVPAPGQPAVICGYKIYYEIIFPGFSAQQCYNMYVISDIDFPTDEPPFTPYPGLNPTAPPARIVSEGPMNVCVCPEQPADVCSANFTFSSTVDPSFTPNFIGKVTLNNFHPLSNYIYSWGDGTYDTWPGAMFTSNPTHLYAPGTYTVCVTETTPDGSSCNYCVNFCVAGSMSGPLTPSPSTLKRSAIENTAKAATLYPNPANGTTILDFELAAPTQVSVSVLDMSGKVVEVIAKRALEQGAHKIELNTEHLAAGTYQVQLETGAKVQVQKLVVIK
jgi:hypothetical protein